MSDIDLTEAIDASERAIWKHANRDVTGRIDHPTASRLAVRAVRAAAPLIEAAVRERIVREIEERRADLLDPSTPGYLNIGDPRSWITGTRWAANIARGEQP